MTPPTSDAKLQVYFNSACPVCDAGVRYQRGQPQSCQIEWIDVHQQPEALTPSGLDLESVRERLHVRDAEGRMHIGVDAFAQLWSHTPRQAWLAWLVRRDRWLSRPFYNWFARRLYRWNLRRHHWTAKPSSTDKDPS